MLSFKRLSRGDLRIEDLGSTVYVLSSFAHYGVRALLRPPVRRNTDFVMTEYNNDREEFWKPELSYEDFVYGNSVDPLWALIDHKVTKSTWADIARRSLPSLLARIEQYSKPGDLIVEYGAGTGRNLAYLAHSLPDRKFLGLELTPRSVEDARRQLKKLGLPVEMQVHDATTPYAFAERPAVAYSRLALEQLPGTMSRDALREMSKASRAVVCFEPIRELYGYSLRGLTSRLRQYRADYLGGLPNHARELGLNIVVERATGLAHTAFNEICELVIETGAS